MYVYFSEIASFRIIRHQKIKLYKNISLLKTGFVANDKWQQASVFDLFLLRHKCE